MTQQSVDCENCKGMIACSAHGTATPGHTCASVDATVWGKVLTAGASTFDPAAVSPSAAHALNVNMLSASAGQGRVCRVSNESTVELPLSQATDKEPVALSHKESCCSASVGTLRWRFVSLLSARTMLKRLLLVSTAALGCQLPVIMLAACSGHVIASS